MARSNEPAVWSLFAGGGALTALILPVHALALTILLPLGVIEADSEKLVAFLGHPLFRLYMFVLALLGLFHGAHRLRFTLIDLGLHALATPITWLCYGGATIGSLVALWVAVSF